MDWSTYKMLCDRPDYWSRWMLDQVEALLAQLQQQELLAALRQHRAVSPLPQPADHKGPAQTHMYQLSLPLAQRRLVLAAVEQAHAQGLTTAATRGRGLGGFVEAWREYVAFSDPLAELGEQGKWSQDN
ncbi:MAG: hypothetical protein AAF993_14530 [Pseudomonadota bacterium]